MTKKNTSNQNENQLNKYFFSNPLKHSKDLIKKNIDIEKLKKKLSLANKLQSSKDIIKKNIDFKKLKGKYSFSNLFQRSQDFIERSIEGEKLEVVLKQSTFWAKVITWSLMGGTAFGIAWLSIAKTEEIIIATGIIEPIDGVVEIKIPSRGITNEILIKEGERVKKGQVLIKLDTQSSEAKQISLRKSKEINTEILESLEFLVKEGAVSKIQYLQQKNKLSDLESEISQNNFQLKYQKIVSPVDGMVFDLKPKKPGYVADPSLPVMKIVPNSKLEAKIEIESKSIGFVSVGKLTDISIDSYPASDFGVIEGRIKSISSDALPPEPNLNKGFRFPAKIELKNQYLQLKNKKKLPLQVGMSLTANIKLRKVSYLQLLLNTFQQKTDSLRTLN